MYEPISADLSDDAFSEAAMLTVAMDRIPNLIGARASSTFSAREVKVARSIADAVFVEPRRSRTRKAMRPLSVVASVVLSTLRRYGPMRVDILEKRCGVGARELRNGLLDDLQGQRLLRRAQGGRISGAGTWVRQLRLIAIEAKLLKWRQALSQASAYRRYADESYVLLPESVAGIARRHAQAFAAEGVGLISAQRDGLTILLPSARSKEHDWQREFVCSRLLSSLIDAGFPDLV